jgi:enediyne biosynthesis protein E4
MRKEMRRWGLVLLLAVVAGGLLRGGWSWYEIRRYRRAMAEIQEEMEYGRSGTAARKLTDLLAWKPNSDEAAYLLGTCEIARGRTETAVEVWSRIPPGSPFAPKAILGRMQIQMERGRLADAERIIRDALDDPRIDGSSLPILLGPVYSQEGRLEDAERSIEARWDHLNQRGEGGSEKAINLVRLHLELRQNPIPTEAIGAFLEQAGRSAPEDDRVWLGKANLAIRVGSYAEAARWLDACLRRRPEDVPVWRARLSWAVATNRVAEVQAAMDHLPAQESTPVEIHRLAAWLAARRGDPESERRALERLIADDRADMPALDRLVELADREGQSARAAELRQEKAAIDPLAARYKNLYRRNQPRRDASEMARLAEQLGRWFEARAFLTIATAVEPDRDDFQRDLDRLSRRARSIDHGGRTLTDVIASETRATQPR